MKDSNPPVLISLVHGRDQTYIPGCGRERVAFPVVPPHFAWHGGDASVTDVVSKLKSIPAPPTGQKPSMMLAAAPPELLMALHSFCSPYTLRP